MSILNRPGDGNRSVLTVIYRLLLQEGPLDYHKIVNLCAPEGVVEPEATRYTLNTWCDLGVFSKEGDRVSIDPKIKKPERGESFLPTHARARVLMSGNNERFWEVENSKASDFCRAVSWLLAQDVYAFDCNSWSEAEPLIKRQVGDVINLIVQNDTRWSGFKDWVTYLGFAWTSRLPRSGSLIIDPTYAVRDALPHVFRKAKTLRANQFLEELSNWVPVLDGGVYRSRVEDELLSGKGEHAWVSVPSEQISSSLSRGLLRLENMGILKCEDKSDSPDKLILTGRNGSGFRTLSHFTLLNK
jgi:hypothetical protein